MKKLMIIVTMLGMCIMTVSAQTKKEQKAAAKELQQEVTRLTNEGWSVFPGDLPLSKQLTFSYEMRAEERAGKIIIGQAETPGKTFDAANMQALTMIKLDIARKLETTIKGIVDNEVANTQLSSKDAESITKTVAASIEEIGQSFGRIITIMAVKRELPNGTVVVRTSGYCDADTAYSGAKKTLRKILANESKELLDKVEAMEF